MTVELTRVRIAGFKSFAEPATVDILPGLTGIVGPNGCGKSNVVEALRWAMGETSIKSLRGGEMDDVIFAGTSARASRNLAEVTITLARGAAALPDPFSEEDELQVTRRIERGAGSSYKGNGREMRARDVQTLFADLASGAHSSAMVSQGKVAALVNAKPEQRRQVLEEAAGITGLHARRHEAELKLRAAETNLQRAEELRTQLDESREGLRRQAKQASRFRNISDLVRNAETEFLAVQHARAGVALAAAEQAQREAAFAVEDSVGACAAAEAAVAAAEAGLTDPRAAEASARSLLERRRFEAEQLGEEAARAARALADAEARLAQLDADLEDAARLEADARAAATALDAESAALASRLEALPAQLAAQAARVEEVAASVQADERVADAASRRAAEAEAASYQAALALAAAESRVTQAAAAHADAVAACGAARAALIPPDRLAAMVEAAATAETAWSGARVAAEEAERRRAACAEDATRAGAAAERAAAQWDEAQVRLREAAARQARTESALAEVEASLAAARAVLVPAEAVLAAHEAAERAQKAAEAAEREAQQAEIAQGGAAGLALEATAAFDAVRAEHARLTASVQSQSARQVKLTSDWEALAEQIGAAEAALVPADHLTAAHVAADAARVRAQDAAASLASASERRVAAEAALAAARAAAAAAAADAARLRAEAEGLHHALAGGEADTASLLDAITVPPGLEAAIGAALAHAEGGLDEASPAFWRTLPGLPAPVWPAGATCLADLVAAPAALARLLGFTALLGDAADGDALQAALPPGCVLVSRDGAGWRWDGQIVRAGAPSAAAVRLRQRARLMEVEALLAEAQGSADRHALARADAEAGLRAAQSDEAEARESAKSADAAQAETSRALAALAGEAERAEAGLAALQPAMLRLEDERAATAATLREGEAALAALPDLEQVRAAAAAAAAAASRAADHLVTSRATRESARAEAAAGVAALQRVQAAAAEAESRVAALAPQQTRLLAERSEAAAAVTDARAAGDGVPDVALLRAAASDAANRAEGAEAALVEARAAVLSAEQAMRLAAGEAGRLEQVAAEARHALTARETVLARAAAELERDSAALAAARAAQAALPDPAELAGAADAARVALAERRMAHAEAAAAQSELLNTQAALLGRAPSLHAEQAAWRARTAEAERRRAAVAGRREAACAEAAALAEAPLELTRRAERSGAALEEAESAHAQAGAALQAAETALRSAGTAQRDAEARAAACREAVARGEGAMETAQATLVAVLERAAERLGPGAVLPEASDISDAAEERARRRQERLIRERDEMGPVNLLAESELTELDTRIADIDREREELGTAIAKLRGSIGHLNREGRERLGTVFTQVDQHFRALFTRMMGGGRAHLALTGSDDPLEAGLEIYAEPPGKKLSTLSLLSGGEQALTALSLIFAVFRCTPAPVAVLDEVDAPLDDANVERFCSLLDDVVRETGTRFLVVTHHQLTMSRMDRLYGVTMQERGVSRLLSVDLRRAAEMVEGAQPVLEAAE